MKAAGLSAVVCLLACSLLLLLLFAALLCCLPLRFVFRICFKQQNERMSVQCQREKDERALRLCVGVLFEIFLPRLLARETRQAFTPVLHANYWLEKALGYRVLRTR